MNQPEIENLDYKPNNTVNISIVDRAIVQAKRIEDALGNMSAKSPQKDLAIEEINLFHRQTLMVLRESLK